MHENPNTVSKKEYTPPIKKIARFGNDRYNEIICGFTKLDSILGLMMVFIWLPVAALFLHIAVSTEVLWIGFNITSLTNLSIVVILFLILRLRKQGLDTVGISKKNWIKSSIFGIIIGLIIFLPRAFAGVVTTNHPGLGVVHSIFHYFIAVSFAEEIVFRGYLQTRIYSVVKSDFWAVFFTGFIFALLHPVVFYIASFFLGYEFIMPLKSLSNIFFVLDLRV